MGGNSRRIHIILSFAIKNRKRSPNVRVLQRGGGPAAQAIYSRPSTIYLMRRGGTRTGESKGARAPPERCRRSPFMTIYAAPLPAVRRLPGKESVFSSRSYPNAPKERARLSG